MRRWTVPFGLFALLVSGACGLSLALAAAGGDRFSPVFRGVLLVLGGGLIVVSVITWGYEVASPRRRGDDRLRFLGSTFFVGSLLLLTSVITGVVFP